MNFTLIFAAGCVFVAALVTLEVLLHRRLRRPVHRRARPAIAARRPVEVIRITGLEPLAPPPPAVGQSAVRAIPASVEEVPR